MFLQDPEVLFIEEVTMVFLWLVVCLPTISSSPDKRVCLTGRASYQDPRCLRIYACFVDLLIQFLIVGWFAKCQLLRFVARLMP